MKTNDVIGLGNTLMDFLIEIDESKFAKFNLKKGEFHLVNEDKAKELLEKIEQDNLEIETFPGGSSANCLRGISLLGGKAILCGRVGQDKEGDLYIQLMKQQGVDTRINPHSSVTGHAITFITPDAERTFSVHLGAALKLSEQDILEEDIKSSKILHLEGYQIEGATRKTVLYAIELAKKHGTLVSIDLADPGVIRRNKEFFQELVRKDIDILFVNKQEALEFTGLQEEAAARELGKQVKIAIVKLGEQGALICHNNEIIKINPFQANVVDTTGAGDTFAAGLLYGYCQNWSLQKAGELGALLASKIVEKKGVKINELNIEELKSRIIL